MLFRSPNMIAIAKQADEIGMKEPLLSWSLWQDPASLAVGTAAEEIVYSYPEDPRELASKTAFKQRFREAYGEEPTIYAGNAYDSYKILVGAIAVCGRDRECITTHLASVKDYEGANGIITVDARGVTMRPEVSMKTVRSGAFVEMKISE